MTLRNPFIQHHTYMKKREIMRWYVQKGLNNRRQKNRHFAAKLTTGKHTLAPSRHIFTLPIKRHDFMTPICGHLEITKLRSMEACRIKFLLKSVYEVLPTPIKSLLMESYRNSQLQAV